MGSLKLPLTLADIDCCPKRPWLCKRGFALPDEQLKLISKTWDHDTWERYLKWIETPRKESLVTHKKFKQLLKNYSLAELHEESELDETLHNLLTYALNSLTPKQLEVITLIFWEGRTLRYIAEQMGIHWTSVRETRDQALKKIKNKLSNTPYTRRM